MDAVKLDICKKGSKHLRGTKYDLKGTHLCEGIWRLYFESSGKMTGVISSGYPCLNGVIVSLERIVWGC